MRKVRYETNNYLEKVHSCDSEDAVVFKIIGSIRLWDDLKCVIVCTV